MGCNRFILAQKEFEYFFPPVGAKIPALHLELLQVAHILPFFIIPLFFIVVYIYPIYYLFRLWTLQSIQALWNMPRT